MSTSTQPTEHRFLEPLDVLFLRANKLFGDPGSYGESLVPPWPSAAAGALRRAHRKAAPPAPHLQHVVPRCGQASGGQASGGQAGRQWWAGNCVERAGGGMQG